MKRARLATGIICQVLVGALAWAAKPAQPPGAPVDPANAIWMIEVSGVAFGQPMRIHLATANGKVVRAFGLGAGRGVHDVDAAGLMVTPASLKGPLRITANPDQWFPKDGKAMVSQIEVDGLIKEGRLGGTYKGRRGDQEASGMFVGTLRESPKAAPQGTILLELEQAVEGPVVEQRVRLSLVLRDGKVTQVTAEPRDARQWKGTVKEHSLSASAEAVSGEVTVQVNEPLDVTGGTYTFTLDGKVIGSTVAGRCKSKVGGRQVADSAGFSGTVGP